MTNNLAVQQICMGLFEEKRHEHAVSADETIALRVGGA